MHLREFRRLRLHRLDERANIMGSLHTVGALIWNARSDNFRELFRDP
jgi:hypothetical protein